MRQDPNQQSQYGRGYRASTQPPRPSDTFDSQQYGQQQQRQSGTYQPPGSAARGTGAHDPTSTGLNARTEALLSYVLGWFSGLIFFVIERKNRFVRFHAAQSFIFFGIVSVVYIVIRLLSIIPF